MELFRAIEARVSVRAYLQKPVSESDLEKVMHAACLAPSAGNLQAYRIIVVRGKKEKEAIAAAAHDQNYMVDAPLLLAFIADGSRNRQKYGKRGEEFYSVQDATIAAAYAQLAAVALGLGTVWVGGYDEGKVCRILKLKAHEKPAVILPLGYPAEEREGHERRKLGDVAREL